MIVRPSSEALASAKKEQNITFVRKTLGELRAVAESENADLLCYLIEMAYLEAGDELARQNDPVTRKR